MVLIATVVGGLVAGAIWGFGKKSLVIFTAVWLVAFAVQTLFMADSADTGKAAYWVLSGIFFGLGIALIGVGVWARDRSEN
ncbi:MAG: hypothetical protein DWP92_01015 [Armatimonadetes bacterium]|nr:MAG: hypothetical protein DWP92_01015 [Armatimonadota bacterium]